jgi:hypothetical protein
MYELGWQHYFVPMNFLTTNGELFGIFSTSLPVGNTYTKFLVLNGKIILT